MESINILKVKCDRIPLLQKNLELKSIVNKIKRRKKILVKKGMIISNH